MCQKAPVMSVSAELKPHPATDPGAVRQISVTLDRTDDRDALAVGWRVDGDIARLRWPEPSAPLRADGLWQHSCFEAFLRAGDDDSYFEFNFSPSGAWACYRFDRRRSGRSLPDVAAPVLQCRRETDAFTMTAILPLAGQPELSRARPLRAGLAAVVEDARGMLGYWALAHAAPRPDFHDPAGFTLAVPAR